MIPRILAFLIGMILAVASALCVTLGSLQFTLLVLLPFWLPFGFLLRVLFFGGKNEGQLERRKFTVLLGSSVLSTFGLVMALILIQPQRLVLHPPHGFAAYETPMSEKERDYAIHLQDQLGWAPFDAKSKLGMWQTPVDPDREQILVLGDSVMYAWGVLEEQTAAAQLDTMLPEYQVINLAVSGWSIDQYYLYLKETISKTQARVVIVGLFVGNDFQVSARGYGWGHSKPIFHVKDGALVHQNPGLSANNCIDTMAQSLLFKPFWHHKIFAQKVLKTVCAAEDLPLEEAEKTIAALVDGIAETAKGHGASVLFLLLPDINDYPHIGSYHYRHLVSFYPFFRALMRDRSYDFIDVADIVAASSETMQRDLFVDQDHYTPEGHRRVAKKLADHLRENYLRP